MHAPASRRGAVSEIQPYKALYYPHPEFPSSAWVKSALLYWEGIVRFVPLRLYGPRDDPEIRELEAAGLVENVPPGHLGPLWTRTARVFARRVEDLLSSHGDDVLRSLPPLSGLRGVAPDTLREAIETGAHQMEAQGFAIAARALRTEPLSALGLYFTAVADVVAHERCLAPVTDDPTFDAITTYLDNARVEQKQENISPAEALEVAQLFIPTPSAEAVAALPVARLLEIRRKYAQQRRSFREKVQAHASAIAHLPTLEAVRDHMSAFAREIQEDVDAAREAMREANVKDRWALLGISAPASIAAGIQLAGASTPLLGPVGTAGSLALAVTSWVMQKRKSERNPAQHYLLLVERAVGARDHGLGDALQKLTRG
jgi:hypothetical protein